MPLWAYCHLGPNKGKQKIYKKTKSKELFVSSFNIVFPWIIFYEKLCQWILSQHVWLTFSDFRKKKSNWKLKIRKVGSNSYWRK